MSQLKEELYQQIEPFLPTKQQRLAVSDALNALETGSEADKEASRRALIDCFELSEPVWTDGTTIP